MVKEFHHTGKWTWPDNQRVAVALTFDFQGGEDVRPGPDGLMDHEEYTQCEYGPHTAIWRILRILEEEGVKGPSTPAAGSRSAIRRPSRRSSTRGMRSPATAIITRSPASSPASRKTM